MCSSCFRCFRSDRGIAQLRFEITASFRRRPETVPIRTKCGTVAIFPSGLGRYIQPFGAPEIANHVALPVQHIEYRHVPIFANFQTVWQRVEDGITGIEMFPRLAAQLCAELAESRADLAQVILLRASALTQQAAGSRQLRPRRPNGGAIAWCGLRS